jgi:hypothetical protein
MSNKTYDIIKNIALIATPVLAFLASLVTIWDLPYGPQLTATFTAIDTLLGALVVTLKINYEKKQGGEE